MRVMADPLSSSTIDSGTWILGFAQEKADYQRLNLSKEEYVMALTISQILFRTAIAFLVILIVLEFMPPIGSTNVQTLAGIVLTAGALGILVSSALMRRGKLKAGSRWGRSATEQFWFGVAFVIIGLSHLAHLVVENNLLGSQLRLAAGLIGLVLMWVGRSRAKALGEI
jgi:hypothetical protein